MMQQDVQVKEGRRVEEIPQRWRQPKGEDRTEKKKEVKALREKGKCDIFFGIEFRMRKEEMEEQFNKRQRKDGDVRRMQRESQMKEQAARIESTHQEESLLQSIAVWEQLSDKKKEQWHVLPRLG